MKIFVTLLFFMMFPAADAVAQYFDPDVIGKENDADIMDLGYASEDGSCDKITDVINKKVLEHKAVKMILMDDLWLHLFIKDGKCLKENPEKAFDTIKAMAETGGIKEASLLSYYYKEGIGTKKDIEESEKWYEIATYRKINWKADPLLENELFPEKLRKLIIERTRIFFPVEMQQKTDIIIKSGAWAQYLTGMNLLKGTNGFPKDAVAACGWLNSASRSDEHEAGFQLYKMFNDLIRQKRYVALLTLSIAAKNGSGKAQKEVGLRMLEGDGYEKNFMYAYNWLFNAEKNGEDTAKYLRQLEKEHPKEVKDAYVFIDLNLKGIAPIRKDVRAMPYSCAIFNRFNYIQSKNMLLSQ